MEPLESRGNDGALDRSAGISAGGSPRATGGGAPDRALSEQLDRLLDPEQGWRRLEEADPAALLDLGSRLLAAASEERRALEAEEGVRAPDSLADPPWARLLLDWCDATRRVPFLKRISGRPEGERWLELIRQAGDAADYTVGKLFRRRVQAQPDRIWLRTVGKDDIAEYSLEAVGQRVDAFARGLHSLFQDPPAGRPVAILAENSLQTIAADLACLTTGLVDVTIPADVTGEQAAYVLEQTEAEVLLIGSDAQVEKMLPVLGDLSHLRSIIQIGSVDGPGRFGTQGISAPAAGGGPRLILSAAELLERGESISDDQLRRRLARPRWNDVATLMYTSGTTGLPKGILFAHRNLVFKRFARALALPEIGEEDHFLCFLPLYHTFGRWLEMLGTLFWGATYSALASPSLDSLLDGLRRVAPTVFISIPKRWIQLYDRIRQEVPEEAGPGFVRPAVESVTGGRLRWGLSAAGYLDPAVFRFFQHHGVELLSGFGMTEATGGITMTPPGGYREGAVGPALPGIEIKAAEDGELLIRGSFVMEGYFGPDERERDHRTEWFATGDIVSIDEDGYVTIVDRKKDIYKNVKGQTVSPQRIESFFQSFGEIQQVFLVGDGREYNTILLHPNYDYPLPPLREMTPELLREHLGSIVASVNGFLAPYERILDLALLPRPLALDQEELTPKGTFRRKLVETHFADLIEGMYRARISRLQAGEVEVRIPLWLLRDMAQTLGDVEAGPGALRLPRLGRELIVDVATDTPPSPFRSGVRDGASESFAGGSRAWDGGREPIAGGSRARESGRSGGSRIRIGDLIYEGTGSVADFETILRSPDLWIGNAALIDFTGPVGVRRPQPRRERPAELRPRVVGAARRAELSAGDQRRLEDALWREDRSFLTMHLAAVALGCADEKDGLRLVSYFETLAGGEDSERAELARIPLRRAVRHPVPEVRSAAFRALLPHGAPEMVAPTLTAFLEADPSVLSRAGALALTRRGLPDEIMAAFVAFVGQVHRVRTEPRRRRESRPVSRSEGADAKGSLPPVLDEGRTMALLRFLVVYATEHPGWYRVARTELARWLLSPETLRVREFARSGLERLTAGFRDWLGPDLRLAVDPATGREYGWAQVLSFDPACASGDRVRVEKAVQEIPFIKEAIFVLSGGARVSLAEIPPGGVRVRHLGTRHGKAVYRFSVQTREAGTFEIAVNLVSGMSPEAAENEVLWLSRLAGSSGGRRLVEDLGGFWPEHGLWTEEFVPGETVSALLLRVAAAREAGDARAIADRLAPLWIHLASHAAVSYLDFWNRTGRTFAPSKPSPDNLIVPAHDYQEGSRLVSIAGPLAPIGLSGLLRCLKDGILDEMARRVPVLAGIVGPETLFDAVLDVLGEEAGIRALSALLEDQEALARDLPGEEQNLQAFLDHVRASGYMPRRLAAAIRRYHRWAEANFEATPEARARNLRDLWDSYSLSELEEGRPGIRLRLFRETVFAGSSRELRDELARIIDLARTARISFEALLREMSELVRRLPLSEEEIYFLARMTYAHLRPADTADLSLIEQGGTRVSDLVVTHRDRAGRYFRVRHATTPREVWSLHQLFHASGLNLRFRPGHQFLVAVDENHRVVGGLVYRMLEPRSVHMEKIVVAPTRRRQGISEELMEDFMNRLRSRGVRTLTTGFYRPQYFRRFGFQIDREHAGLVKSLEGEPAETPEDPSSAGADG